MSVKMGSETGGTMHMNVWSKWPCGKKKQAARVKARWRLHRGQTGIAKRGRGIAKSCRNMGQSLLCRDGLASGWKALFRDTCMLGKGKLEW